MKLSRRTLLTAAAAMGGGFLPPQAFAQSVSDSALEGRELLSESAMIVYIGPGAQDVFNLRFGRYPGENRLWLWLHARLNGRFYGFVQHDLPCGAEPVLRDGGPARYDAGPTVAAHMIRSGPANAPLAVSFSAELGLRARTDLPHGAGPVPLFAEGIFQPEHQADATLAGRTEFMGLLRTDLVLNGERFTLNGRAKFHEQVQTAPRFTVPFSYMNLWNGTDEIILTVTPRGTGGQWTKAGVARRITGAALAPPGGKRKLTLEMEGGAETLELDLVERISLPVYGKPWYGSFVTANTGAEPMYGMLNDWRPDGVPYRT